MDTGYERKSMEQQLDEIIDRLARLLELQMPADQAERYKKRLADLQAAKSQPGRIFNLDTPDKKVEAECLERLRQKALQGELMLDE